MNNTSNESSNARKYEYHNDFKRRGVYYLRMNNTTYSKIGALTGVNAKTARNIVNINEKKGAFEKGKSTGRKPKVSEGDIKLLIRFVQQDQFAAYP